MRYSPRPQGVAFDGGAFVKKILMSRYMTQRQLAESIGMAQARLSDILNGHQRPSKMELMAISVTLGINIEDWKKESVYVREAFPVQGNDFGGGGLV